MYALKLWPALTRYCDDGRIEIDNSAAGALRGIALGRRNYLFAGAGSGGAQPPHTQALATIRYWNSSRLTLNNFRYLD